MPNNSIDLFKGDNRMIRVYVKNERLDILDLNGAEARFFLAESTKSTSYIFKKTTSIYAQGVIRTPERGEVVFFIESDDTATLPASQYFYEIIVILSSGQRYTVASGVLNLRSNLEYGEEPITPIIPLVDVPINSSSIDITVSANEILIPMLIAPNGTTDNIWITNVVYGTEKVTIYFSSQIQEIGWKVSYILNRI